MTFRILANLTLTLLLVLAGAGATFAQAVSSEPMYDSEGQPYGKSYYRRTAPAINVALVRQPELGPDFFVLRLSSTESYSGCPKFSAIPFEVNFGGRAVNVKIGKYTVDMRKLTSAPQYDCDTSTKIPAAEIPFSSTDLRAKGAKFINIESDGGMRSYGLELTDNHVRLVPSDMATAGDSYFRTQKISGRKNALMHWFYPENTIILSAAGVKDGEDVSAQLDKLADQKGYAPLETVYPDFRSPLAGQGGQYYVLKKAEKKPVTKGKKKSKEKSAPEPVAAVMPSDTSGAAFGTITVNRTVYRLDMSRDEAHPLQVFARAPGAND